jgi:6-phosphogluconate dehydrogenase (decarboxylating)
VGLGAIGVQIANAASMLGMKVIGFDPSITIKSAWKLSADVEQALSVDELFSQSDFVSFHVPLVEGTKHLLNEQRIALLPKGATVLNFARDGYYHFQDSPLLGLQPSSHSCLLPQLLMLLNVAKQSLYRGLFYHQLENPSHNI